MLRQICAPGGKVIICYENGNKYYGYGTVDNITDGTMYFANGTQYEGTFVNNKCANGVFISPSGERSKSSNPLLSNSKCTNGDMYYGKIFNGIIDGEGSCTYANGASYKGTYESGKRHGTGVYRYANGNVYNGTFNNDVKHGQGTYTYANGDVYVGAFANGKRHGPGKIVKAGGDTFEGTFNNGLSHGNGKLTKSSGTTYIGNFNNNTFTGKVTTANTEYKYTNGKLNGKCSITYYERHHTDKPCTYRGDIENGVPHGYGEISLYDGQLISGNFIYGIMDGKITIKGKNGIQEYNMSRGKLYGIATFTNAKGNTYTGEFLSNVPHGKGTLTLKDGQIITAYFENGIIVGRCSITDASNMLREYNFVNGKLRGYAKCSNAKGDVYIGEFVDDLPHGKGILHLASGETICASFDKGIISGKWVLQRVGEDGCAHEYNFDGAKLCGNATFANTDGDTYSGEFKNSMPHGKGTLSLKSGEHVDGYFENGLLTGKFTLTTKDGTIQQYNANGKKISGYATYTNVNGDKYTGDFLDNVPHGNGTLVLKSGKTITGAFENGYLHGKCTVTTYANGNVQLNKEYIFNKGKLCDKGRCVDTYGNMYDGDFYMGVAHGNGTLYLKDKRVIIGTFENGYLHGSCDVRSGDKTQICEFKFGKVCGQCTFSNAKGDTYIGAAVDNLPCGKGKLIFSDESEISGPFVKGYPNGECELKGISGYKYTGFFKDGNISGAGKGNVKNRNGDICEGEYMNGYLQGKCTIWKASGEYFSGIIKNSAPIEGQWILPSGVYDGKFDRGTLSGSGNIIRTNYNYTYTGTFTNGLEEGIGKITYGNGDTYTGEFARGKKNGNGTYTIANGNITYTGTFKDDICTYVSISYPNGGRYTGGLNNENGLYQGWGILKTDELNGEMYEGGFNNGKKSGFGTLFKNGAKYESFFTDDVIGTFAQITYNGGKRYVGEISPMTMLPHGYGVIQFKGSTKKGMYENGVITSKHRVYPTCKCCGVNADLVKIQLVPICACCESYACDLCNYKIIKQSKLPLITPQNISCRFCNKYLPFVKNNMQLTAAVENAGAAKQCTKCNNYVGIIATNNNTNANNTRFTCESCMTRNVLAIPHHDI